MTSRLKQATGNPCSGGSGDSGGPHDVTCWILGAFKLCLDQEAPWHVLCGLQVPVVVAQANDQRDPKRFLTNTASVTFLSTSVIVFTVA